jgi:hypothetical protein
LLLRIHDPLEGFTREIVENAKRQGLLLSERLELEQTSVRVILTPNRPDTGDEGDPIRFRHSMDDLVRQLSAQGAVVESRLLESMN